MSDCSGDPFFEKTFAGAEKDRSGKRGLSAVGNAAAKDTPKKILPKNGEDFITIKKID